jgi:hypothetical protein
MMRKHRILGMILIIVGLPLITWGLMSFRVSSSGWDLSEPSSYYYKYEIQAKMITCMGVLFCSCGVLLYKETGV